MGKRVVPRLRRVIPFFCSARGGSRPFSTVPLSPGNAHRALRLSPRDPFTAVYDGIAAYTQFVGRNYEEAMRLSREAIRLRGDFVGAHRMLTAAAAMAGQGDVAKTALQELRRV
jgi:hypothetical protein